MNSGTHGRALFLCAILTLALGWLVFPGRVAARDIDVELVWKFGQGSWVEIQVSAGNYLLQGDGQTLKEFPAGSSLQLGWGGWAPFWRINQGDYEHLTIKELTLKASREGSLTIRTPEGVISSYRGELTVAWTGDHFQLMNHIEMENYLKGVVPMEMNNGWAGRGMEALKAQAIAARTYTVKHTQGGKPITDSPDKDQAYGGKGVEGAATYAVEETRGEILVDDQSLRPIDALYSAHNGGMMEEAQNVWGNPDPHYTTRPDPYSLGIGGAADRWQFQVSAPRLGQAFDLGPIEEIELDKYPSGRVKKVSMSDIWGRAISVSGRELVRKFYPSGPINSQAFLGILFETDYLSTNGGKPVGWGKNIELSRLMQVYYPLPQAGPLNGKIVSSSEGTQPSNQGFGLFVFDGRGWGHGVGMSQWGAYHMAQDGYSYLEILDFYYARTKVIKASS